MPEKGAREGKGRSLCECGRRGHSLCLRSAAAGAAFPEACFIRLSSDTSCSSPNPLHGSCSSLPASAKPRGTQRGPVLCTWPHKCSRGGVSLQDP